MLPVPVTIVSGFLGAGKTTLVNRILAGDHGLSIAVIINDVGAINVDAKLVAGASDGVVSLKNGCVCCSMRPDLVQHVGELVRERNPEHIVIEASGVSEPGSIVRALGYPQLVDAVFLNAVVTVIDAEQFPHLSGTSQYLANEQLAEADIVVLNKSDLVPVEVLGQVLAHCKLPGNFVQPSIHAEMPMSLLIFDGKAGRRAERPDGGQSRSPSFDSRTWKPGTAIDLAVLRSAVGKLPPAVFRTKGFVTCSKTGQRWLLQKVGSRATFQPVAEACDDALVLIGERGAVDWDEALATLGSVTPPTGG